MCQPDTMFVVHSRVCQLNITNKRKQDFAMLLVFRMLETMVGLMVAGFRPNES